MKKFLKYLIRNFSTTLVIILPLAIAGTPFVIAAYTENYWWLFGFVISIPLAYAFMEVFIDNID